MIDARCSCGAVVVSLPGPTNRVAACHCIDCQRRTGAPFGIGAFYPTDSVKISGAPKEYVRAGESGGKVRAYFCPDCGSTVYWDHAGGEGFVAVAVGAFADPGFPPPTFSVYAVRRHPWVSLPPSVVESWD